MRTSGESGCLEQPLQYQFAAKKGQGKQDKTTYGPAGCSVAAPAKEHAATDQRCIKRPSDQRKYGFVDQALGKQVINKQEARNQGCRQQDQARPDHLKQQPIHGLEWWQ